MNNFQAIEEKRQNRRQESNIYQVKEDENKPKFYILDMFPYPSGAGLHVGHPKGYIASDVLTRKKILEGFSVLHPMGFDTFGLGTEQYAIENKMKPQVVAQQNIQNFIGQLKNLGLTYDRDRSFSTADPDYYKRTQRIFLQFYNHYYDEEAKKAKPIAELQQKLQKQKKSDSEIQEIIDNQRLAYIDHKPINRCPHCKTGLANEDLDDGKCERCGSEVEQKPMRQRVLRITKYAERLIEGLDTLDREQSAKDLQANRIGKSEGSQFQMQIKSNKELSFEIYTTRLDTVFGMTFVVMAPEHPLVDKITTSEYLEKVEKYKEQAKHKTQLERTELQKEKTGQFTGAYAINPFNGQEVPIYIGDYVLANYGTGVVMAVPAHDERDFEFAKKYDIPVIQSIAAFIKEDYDNKYANNINYIDSFTSIIKHSCEEKYLVIKFINGKYGFVGGKIDGSETKEEALKREIMEETGYTNFEIQEVLLDRVFGEGYKPHKNRVDRCDDKVFLVNLIDENNIGVSDEELKKHTIEWIERDQINNLNLVDHHRFYWNRYLEGESAYPDKGIVVNSGKFSGMSSDEAIVAMQNWLEKNNLGGKKTNYKIQDWVFSRQRYRGEPFPIVFCEKCGTVPLSEKDLPLTLPDVENYEPTGTEEGPLANIDSWINTTCPKCGSPAKRESNTMPGRAGSSRYWLRFMDNKNQNQLVSPKKEKYRGNVDLYVGGAEHVTRHMIYARFWQQFLYDIGIVGQQEPFKKYTKVGLIMAEDGRKMSKRRGNVVNPDDIIAEYGSDTLRTYEMFMGPFEQAIARNTNGIKGIKKFLDKIYLLFDKISPNHESDKNTQILLNQSIKKVGEDIDGFRHNTAISQLMILVNHLSEQTEIDKESFEKLCVLISPFAPHLAEELREKLGHDFSIFTKSTRPKYDEKFLVADTITLAVQFNGKMRGTIEINKDATQDEALNQISNDEKLAKQITGEIKKIIYIPGKIINIIL